MTAAKKKPLDPAGTVLDAACHQVIETVQFGLKVGRQVPIAHLAKRLQVAAEEASLLDEAAS